MADAPVAKQPSGVAHRGADAKHVVVVGGGVTGLTAAYRLQRAQPDWRVTLLEAGERLGGNIVTVRENGFVIDGGPDSFVSTKPAALKLSKELGLEAELISTRPESRGVFLVHGGRLEAMPAGMALGVPTRPGPLLRSNLLGWRSKLRLFAEPFMPAGEGDGDESVFDFLERRLGAVAAEQLAGPLLGGIYAGDIRRLSMRATFPQLIELERRHRSLVVGTLAMRAAGKRRGEPAPRSPLRRALELLAASGGEAASPFVSFREGMMTLIDALADALPPGSVRTGSAVLGLRQAQGRWRVELAGEQLAADAVVLACPARVAAEILADSAARAELASIEYLSTATVFYALKRADVAHDLRGVGFVVPPGEGKILAGTFISSKWPHRAPDGKVLLRAFFGGVRGGAELPEQTDAGLAATGLSELRRLMGHLGEPEWTRVFRYHHKNPQPNLGHLARVERLQAGLPPGLELAGAAYEGVGIPDCVSQAEGAAARIVQQLS